MGGEKPPTRFLYIYIVFFLNIYSGSLCTGIFSTYFFWTAPTTSGWCWYQNYPDGQKWNGQNWWLLLRSQLYLGIPNCSSSNSAIFSRTRKRGPFVHCGSSFWTPPVNFPLRGRYKPQEHQVLSGRILISKRKSRKTNQATFSSHFCFNLVDIPSSSNLAHFISSITMTEQALGFARS